MPAYVIVSIDIHDPAMYERYKQLAPPSIGLYGGKYLTRGGAVEVLEGDWTPRRFVILEFPSMEKAKAWHDSPEYAPALAQRQSCATSLMLLAEGLPVPFIPPSPAPPAATGGAA
jgi:uncharacterized protein (DUF1330 family)